MLNVKQGSCEYQIPTFKVFLVWLRQEFEPWFTSLPTGLRGEHSKLLKSPDQKPRADLVQSMVLSGMQPKHIILIICNSIIVPERQKIANSYEIWLNVWIKNACWKWNISKKFQWKGCNWFTSWLHWWWNFFSWKSFSVKTSKGKWPSSKTANHHSRQVLVAYIISTIHYNWIYWSWIYLIWTPDNPCTTLYSDITAQNETKHNHQNIKDKLLSLFISDQFPWTNVFKENNIDCIYRLYNISHYSNSFAKGFTTLWRDCFGTAPFDVAHFGADLFGANFMKIIFFCFLFQFF